MQVTINIPTDNQVDSFLISKSLETLVQNLTKENIQLLAEKSKKPGMNEKLQKYKALI